MPNTERTLDKLLTFIDKYSDGELKPFFTDTKLNELIQEHKPDLDGNELPNLFYEIQRMLNKLIKDGYIDFEYIKKHEVFLQNQVMEVIKGRNYYITYEGRCFTGYVQQKKDKEAILLEKQENVKKAASDSLRLADGTMYLWIATSALVLIELIRFLHDLMPHCH